MSHKYFISLSRVFFDLIWVQRNDLDIVPPLPTPPEVFRPDPPQEYPASKDVGDVAASPSPQQHKDPTVIAGDIALMIV